MGKNCKEAIFTTRPSNPASCHRHARPYPTLPQKASFCHYRATTSLPFHTKPPCHCHAKNPTVIAMQRTPSVIAVLDTAIFLPTYRVTTNKDTFSAKKRPLQKQRPLLSLQQIRCVASCSGFYSTTKKTA